MMVNKLNDIIVSIFQWNIWWDTGDIYGMQIGHALEAWKQCEKGWTSPRIVFGGYMGHIVMLFSNYELYTDPH